jgi:hypothetical protein
MDVKDGWEVFIPSGFRRLLAHRFRDEAAMTANSSFVRLQFEKWFPHQATVVYSGADGCWLKPAEELKGPFRLTLIGSIYSEAS